MEIKKIYREHIERFLVSYEKDKPKVLFFLGFPKCFYEVLFEVGFYRFDQKSSTFFDVQNVDNKEIFTKLIANESLTWAFYEELIVFNDAMKDLTIVNSEFEVIMNNLYFDRYPVHYNGDAFKIIKEIEEEKEIHSKYQRYYADAELQKGILFFSYILKHSEVDFNRKIEVVDFFDECELSENNEDAKAISASDIYEFIYDVMNGKKHFANYNVEGVVLKGQLKSLSALACLFDNKGFKISNIKIEKEDDRENRFEPILKKYWGEDAEFRDIKVYANPEYSNETDNISQGLMINDIVRQCEVASEPDSNYFDIIITAPTGAGKSLFFQIAGIHLHDQFKKITIVITPLIALMQDQVNELNDRGVNFATFINSDLTFEERVSRINGIQSGKFSIVYLSPESLLSSDISNIIGERQIGLLVVDEAHLVTSWGRDFRVDYWFLGDFIEKTRKGSYFSRRMTMQFPVLCLTATAVNGGSDDVVQDLGSSLNLNVNSEHQYIGNVRRDEIEFQISRHFKNRFSKSIKEEKSIVTAHRIKEFVDKKQKAIVYLPYVSQIGVVSGDLRKLHPDCHTEVVHYSGSGMDKFQKNESYEQYRNSEKRVMLATKAFGMGVNIPDIEVVYHFAPTGTLADYIQEVGRVARRLDHGYAMIDYYSNDMRYARTLWGLSGLRHYQLQQMIRKIVSLYEMKKSRNFLFAPEVFNYMFSTDSVDNKVKSGLMLISNDLVEKFQFKILVVRPKNIFTTHFIMVPDEIKDKFLKEFGQYCKNVKAQRTITKSSYSSDTVTYSNPGDIFEIDLATIWENVFSDKTFAQFKYQFFNNELFGESNFKVFPRFKLTIHYKEDFSIITDKMDLIAKNLQDTFNNIYSTFGNKEFGFDAFVKEFRQNCKINIRREMIQILLDLFCFDDNFNFKNPLQQPPKFDWKFIRKSSKDDQSRSSVNITMYSFKKSKRSYIEANLKRLLRDCSPQDVKSFERYLPIPKKNDNPHENYQFIASILEIFNLATYELSGGKNPQIFVRINDPQKLKYISEQKEYKNILLNKIDASHKRSAQLVDAFMTKKLDNNERWNLIENYFLGFEDDVNSILGINEEDESWL